MSSNQSQRQISEDESHVSTVLNVIPAAVAQSVVNVLPFLSRPTPKPMRISPLSGRDYINELLTCGNDARVQEFLRLKRRVFHFRCAKKNGSLIALGETFSATYNPASIWTLLSLERLPREKP